MMVTLPVRQFLRSRKGQSLIEAVAAVALTAVVVVVLSGLAIASVRNAYFAKQQNLASFYAQQGIELTRSIRDQDLAISNYNALGCPGGWCTKWSHLWLTNIPISGSLFKLVSGNTLEYISLETSGETLTGGFTRTVRIFDDPGTNLCGDPTTIKRVLVKVTWKDNKSELATCLTKIENIKS